MGWRHEGLQSDWEVGRDDKLVGVGLMENRAESAEVASWRALDRNSCWASSQDV